MSQSKNFATTAENVQHMHPLSDTLSSGMVQAVEQEIEMALAKGVKSDDPDLVALRQALCEITGSVFTSTFKDLKGRETENNEQYEEASDSDSDDNDAPTFCAEKNGISNTNTNQPVEDVVTSDKQNSNPIDEKTTEKFDSSENVHIKPGFYDSAEFEGIFEQRVVQIGIEAAPDALAREMQIIPLVHRIEIIDIVNDVFPHAKVSITSADDPVIFKRHIVLHFSNLYAPLLYKPLGTLKTRLDNKQDEFQVRIKAQLFWRCAIQVHCQPLSSLVSMVKRRKEFDGAVIEQLEKCKSSARKRFLAVRAWLPLFSMVAEAPRLPSQQNVKQPTTVAEKKHKGDAEKDASTVTRPIKLDPQSKTTPNRPANIKSKENSAARHTYDVGYKKWDNMNVDLD